MFSEILKIIPKLDNKDLANMQKNLQSRFTKIAKGFGKSIGAALKGGGLVGIALGLIDKLLNPLKEVQEAIDRSLKTADDLATNAAQFETSTGNLAKLVTLAKATGLEPDNLYMLITKFQTAVAQARANPNDPSVSAVKNFTDQTDTAEAFYNFIRSLQKMDKSNQLLVQQQVFGEKQILKMADFLQQDFEKLGVATGMNKVSSTDATKKIESLAGKSDRADILTASREFKDLLTKSGVITDSMITKRDQAEKVALQRENQRIQSYENLSAISTSVDKIMMLVENGVSIVGNLVNKALPFIDKASGAIDRFLKSPMVRGISNIFGGKGD